MWPQIEPAVIKDGFVVSQTNTARNVSITPIDFSTLPEGFTVAEETATEGDMR